MSLRIGGFICLNSEIQRKRVGKLAFTHKFLSRGRSRVRYLLDVRARATSPCYRVEGHWRFRDNRPAVQFSLGSQEGSFASFCLLYQLLAGLEVQSQATSPQDVWVWNLPIYSASSSRICASSDYNEQRPQISFGSLTPGEFARRRRNTEAALVVRVQ
jgi:hypothetical protein